MNRKRTFLILVVLAAVLSVTAVSAVMQCLDITSADMTIVDEPTDIPNKTVVSNLDATLCFDVSELSTSEMDALKKLVDEDEINATVMITIDDLAGHTSFAFKPNVTSMTLDGDNLTMDLSASQPSTMHRETTDMEVHYFTFESKDLKFSGKPV